ncbi:MAG: multidrug ABC transporter permease, partial [Mesorhizobium sp.]
MSASAMPDKVTGIIPVKFEKFGLRHYLICLKGIV